MVPRPGNSVALKESGGKGRVLDDGAGESGKEVCVDTPQPAPQGRGKHTHTQIENAYT